MRMATNIMSFCEELSNIHIFDKGTDPMVIIDYQNYYGDHINAVQMPLDAYLNQLDASDNG